jgi:hypothetical protein
VPAAIASAGPTTSGPVISSPSPSPVAVLGTPLAVVRAVGRAAEPFAFPIALVAAVAAFLVVQGRIDRRDPKLAAPPDEQLGFG